MLLKRLAPIWVGFLPLLLVGCGPPTDRANIQSADAQTRAAAIKAAAQRGDKRAVPMIVGRLEDEDQAVRFFAIQGLQQLTGQTLGYLYYKPPGTQRDAIRRWREFAAAASRPAAETTMDPS